MNDPRASAAASATAVLATALSLTTIVRGAWWLLTCLIMVAMIGLNGHLLRRINSPAVLVSCGQFLVLALTMTLLFGSGWGTLPGPTGIRSLVALLVEAIGEIRESAAPVPATQAVGVLVTLGVGLVAVLVDTIVVTGRAPAAGGLVLLTMFAVPTQLDQRILPWWTFAAAAAGFALLLAVGGGSRTGGGLTGTAPGLVAGAVVIGLVTGVVATGVGTGGRLGEVLDPGYDIDPLTSLAGQLDRPDPVELFRVGGEPGTRHLRALTLRRYDAETGVWEPDGIEDGVGIRDDRTLPLPPGTTAGPVGTVTIERLRYAGPWLPVIGAPTRITGAPEDARYDPLAGTAFIQSGARGQPDRYTVQTRLDEPGDQRLRAAVGALGVDRRYLDITGVSPRVRELAATITAGADNPFDRARALANHLRDPANGFRYDLRTKPGGRDPLERFLFEGRTGFCQQFAGSMAVLARAVNVPARVAVGYTTGTRTRDNNRLITTGDAHAWVEVWLAGQGWVQFDPTPGLDGRASPPGYQRPDPVPTPGSDGAQPSRPPVTGPAAPAPLTAGPVAPGPVTGSGTGGAWWYGLALVVGALVVLAVPGGWRRVSRRHRLRLAAAGGADAAWREVTATVADRGVRFTGTVTARAAAAAVVRDLGLDEQGARSLRELVETLERAWYGPADTAGTDLSPLVREVVTAVDRARPLPWWRRLLPLSVTRPGG